MLFRLLTKDLLSEIWALFTIFLPWRAAQLQGCFAFSTMILDGQIAAAHAHSNGLLSSIVQGATFVVNIGALWVLCSMPL